MIKLTLHPELIPYWHQIYLENFFSHHEINCEGNIWQGSENWIVFYNKDKRTLYAKSQDMQPEPLLKNIKQIQPSKTGISIYWEHNMQTKYKIKIKCKKTKICTILEEQGE